MQDLVKQRGLLGNETEADETYHITVVNYTSSAKSFDIIMNRLMSNTIKIDSKRIEVQDVGEEYADLQARILTKQREKPVRIYLE